MFMEAEVIPNLSNDPNFKVAFTYEGDEISIKRGIAEVVRRAPRPVITYDNNTIQKLDLVDRDKLELELLNAVINHLFSNGVSRSWKGNIVLNAT